MIPAVLAGLASASTASAQPVTQPGQPGQPSGPAPEAVDDPGAQPAIPVAGRIVDSRGAPISGARIVLDGNTLGTSDSDGGFQVLAPVGVSVIIEHDGHDVMLVNVTGGSLGDVTMTAGARSETIEIRGEAPPPVPGAAKLDRSELQRIPGAGGDVVRALTAMPGVVNLQVPLGFTGVVIRGSSPQDSKVMVDGFEVPLLFHNIAFRSVLPAESIESLDYIPGGFDVASGRASSGIIQVTTRPGSQARSTQGEISLIDGGLVAQGTAGKRTRYMLGLRRSTIDLLLPSLIPDDADISLTTVPRYYDGQLRLDVELSSRWNLMISAFGSDDVLEIVESADENAEAKRLYNRWNFVRASAAASYHHAGWSARLALSGMLPKFEAREGLYQHVEFSYPMVTPRIDLTRSVPALGGLTDFVWTSGAELQVTRADIDVVAGLEPREGEPPVDDDADPRANDTMFKGVVWLPDAAAWTSLAANLHPRIRLTAGVRADYFGRGEQLAVQPRGELQFKLPHALTARLSAGMYTRPPEYQSEILNKELDAERSTQLIAGLTYEPLAGARIQASAYYTDRSELITRVDGTMLDNIGKGTTLGGELLATYRTPSLLGWLSYSYSESTRVDRPGAERRRFDFDQPHSLNAAASWKRGRWQLGGRFQVYSGLPHTPATGSIFDSDRNVYMPTFGEVNSERAPIHHQLDLRIDYSWRWGPASLTTFLDVQNVYMNESVVTYFYGYDYSERAAFKSLPLIPSIGLRGVL